MRSDMKLSGLNKAWRLLTLCRVWITLIIMKRVLVGQPPWLQYRLRVKQFHCLFVSLSTLPDFPRKELKWENKLTAVQWWLAADLLTSLNVFNSICEARADASNLTDGRLNNLKKNPAWHRWMKCTKYWSVRLSLFTSHDDADAGSDAGDIFV